MRRIGLRWPLTLAAALLVLGAGAALTGLGGRTVSFNEEIRPILNRSCIACHGGVKQSGGFSLLSREEALRPAESGKPVIVPGDADRSELYLRLVSRDPEARMPLDHPPLGSAEIRLIRRWIDQGAPWEPHWSFVPPRMPEMPRMPRNWGYNGIDALVYAGLREAGLDPAPEADRRTLIRRLSLDLTGLPPSPEAVEAFEADTRPDAYEQLADSLLASPGYGERWAALWMDLARYADTKGYEHDPQRDLWPYRDWLIRAFSEDMPFDQFTISQLAGDLLPQPAADQLIATAFHRCTMANSEGGTDDEEFRLAAQYDRMRTTWTIWQGLTMECVQCHSHPYEPIYQPEYYRFMAFFNNTQDADLDVDAPVLELFEKRPDHEAAERLAAWLKQQPPAGDTLRRPFNAEIRDALFPRLIPAYADDFHEVTLYHDGAAASWTHNLQAMGNRGYHLIFSQVDFTGLSRILLTYAAQGSQGRVEFRLGSPEGPLAGAYDCRPTTKFIRGNEGGDWDTWKTVPVPIQAPPGRQDLYVVLRNTTGRIPDGVVVVKELELSGPGYAAPGAAQRVRQDSLLQLRRRALRLPVMKDRLPGNARVTRVFTRGNWLTPADTVTPGVPASLPPLPPDAPADRLGMARWLVSPENPLTARVTVNRFWEQLFGTGIVETLEDFGSQGAKPSNQALLDYLALRWMHEHRWSVKQLLREIVLSAAYRQSSALTPEKRERDPYNRLISRGPRVRISAEQVRDQALAACGLLSGKQYGPSVMPYQPDGVWKVVYNGARWIVSDGEDAYRRALYTYWRRTSPYPSMLTFDGSSREFCVPRRIRTNTPLQALVTLNDPVFHEAASVLAARIWERHRGDPAAAVRQACRTLLLREPDPGTFDALEALYAQSLAVFEADAQAAAGMACNAVPESPQLAALTTVAGALMNLDTFLTKE